MARDGLIDGGVITVEWEQASPASLTITGPGTVMLRELTTATTFPYTLAATQTFDVTQNGSYVVTVTYRGVTVASKTVLINNSEDRIVPGPPTGLALLTAQSAAYARITSTDGSAGLAAPTGEGVELVFVAGALDDIRINGVSA